MESTPDNTNQFDVGPLIPLLVERANNGDEMLSALEPMLAVILSELTHEEQDAILAQVQKTITVVEAKPLQARRRNIKEKIFSLLRIKVEEVAPTEAIQIPNPGYVALEKIIQEAREIEEREFAELINFAFRSFDEEMRRSAIFRPSQN